MVVLVGLNLNRKETWEVEKRPFGIEGQVLKAGSSRVELINVSWCRAQPVAKFRAGGRDACPAGSGAKIIAAPNGAGSQTSEAWGPPAMLWLPG